MNTVGLDPLVLTATALQQGLAATGTGLAQAVANTTQVAGLTQTATQQGALGATVVAQQTALVAMDSLPGRLIVLGTRPENVTSPKIQFLSLPNKNGGVSLSPDAQHITYNDQQTLYIANVDGANPQAVDLPLAQAVNWSPNGQRLLLTDGKSLYTMSLNDHLPIALKISNALADRPDLLSRAVVWSSDNQHIALWTASDSDTLGVLSVLDTLKPAQPVRVMLPVTRQETYSQPIWFADGKRLIVRVSGTNSRLLVIDGLSGTQNASLSIPYGAFADPVWVSPNGQWVMFSVALTADDKDGLYVMKSDGSGLKYVLKTHNLGQVDVGWSPDGQRAFISGVPYSSLNPVGDIQWLDTTDMSLQSVLKGQQGFRAWHWSPDGQSLLVCQITQRDERMTPISGKLWLVPVVAGGSPVVLLSTLLCPNYWLP